MKSSATASANMRKPISGGQKKKSGGPRPELTEEQKQEIREAFDLFDSGKFKLSYFILYVNKILKKNFILNE